MDNLSCRAMLWAYIYMTRMFTYILINIKNVNLKYVYSSASCLPIKIITKEFDAAWSHGRCLHHEHVCDTTQAQIMFTDEMVGFIQVPQQTSLNNRDTNEWPIKTVEGKTSRLANWPAVGVSFVIRCSHQKQRWEKPQVKRIWLNWKASKMKRPISSNQIGG